MKYLSIFLVILIAINSFDTKGQTIGTGYIIGSPFCPGGNVDVPFVASGFTDTRNTFTAQLSNASGSFASPTNIGSLKSINSGTIAAKIPTSAIAGSNYRIRVISNYPAITGIDNGSNLSIVPSANCGSSWTTTGNAGISGISNFLGTINDSPLVFKVKNQRSGIIDSLFSNTALGFRSLNNNSIGFKNVAIGTAALKANSTGYNNIAIGTSSMYNNNVGYDNIAIGDSAGGFFKYNISPVNYNPPIPYGNTVVGVKSMTAASYSIRNTAVGYKSLNATTDRSADNVAIGSESLMMNKKGSYNVSIGSQAMYNNTQILYIPAYGAEDPGDNNVAIGYQALYNNKIGDNNSAVGYKSMYSNTTLKNPNPTSDGNQYFSGFDNTAFGNSSLLNNTIGSSNTALGTYSMNSNIKGVGNTTVGANSDIGSDSLFGATAIGFQSKVNCNYCLVLGTVTQSNSEKENTRVGIGTIAPDSSAILELKSSSKGLLIPRMNQAQREGIPTPLEGLLVYQTNNNKGFWYFDGSIWVNISFNNPSLTTVPTFSINSNKNSEIIYIENNLTSPLLGQNIPNPTGKTTLIPYRLPSNCKDAAIVITSMSSGQIIKAIPISARETQLSIDASKLASGSYSYSLYMEGRPVETKKMVIGR